MRGVDRAKIPAVPNTLMAITTAISVPPKGITVLTASAATLSEAAMSGTGSRNMYARLVSR
jgi:hypothetical protein